MCLDEKEKSKKSKQEKREGLEIVSRVYNRFLLHLTPFVLLKVHQGKGTKAIVGHGTKEKNVKGIPKTIHILDPRLLPLTIATEYYNVIPQLGSEYFIYKRKIYIYINLSKFELTRIKRF